MGKFVKGTRDHSGFWGAIRHLFEGNSQKTYLGIKKILEIVLGDKGTQTPMRASGNTWRGWKSFRQALEELQ